MPIKLTDSFQPIGLVVAIVAIFGLGGITSSNVGLDATYTGCLSSNGRLTQVAVGDTPLRSCPRNQTEIHWNQTGPIGAPGEPGPPGPVGPAGPAGPEGAAGRGVETVYTLEIGPLMVDGIRRGNALFCDRGDLAMATNYYENSFDSTTDVDIQEVRTFPGAWPSSGPPDPDQSGRSGGGIGFVLAPGGNPDETLTLEVICLDFAPMRP